MTISLTGRVTSSEQVKLGVSKIYTCITVQGDKAEVKVYLKGNHAINRNDIIELNYLESRIGTGVAQGSFATSNYRILDPNNRDIPLRSCFAEN